MKSIQCLLIVTFLISSTFLFCKTTTSPPPQPTSSSSPISLNININSTINDNHESSKKLINPNDQFDSINNNTNSSLSTEPAIIIHYVDFNLTENFNTSNEFYVVRTNETEQFTNLDANDTNETLIDQGKQMFNQFYTKMTNLMDYESIDTNILYNLWIPFISGFVVGLTLLLILCCCRKCCRRCPCCRGSNKMTFNKSKRGSKKLQSIDDNRYLLVSNHSDSEGV